MIPAVVLTALAGWGTFRVGRWAGRRALDSLLGTGPDRWGGRDR